MIREHSREHDITDDIDFPGRVRSQAEGVVEHRRDRALVQLPEALRTIPGADALRLSAEAIDDHVRYGTGGTCFSLTNALRRTVSPDLIIGNFFSRRMYTNAPSAPTYTTRLLPPRL